MRHYSDGEILAAALRGALAEKAARDETRRVAKRKAANRPLAKRNSPRRTTKDDDVGMAASPVRPMTITNLAPDLEAAMAAMSAIHRENALSRPKPART